MAWAPSGKQLISLLQRADWTVGRSAKHGVTLTKSFGDHTKVTFVPNTKTTLPIGTLMAILGPKQTGIGRRGLSKLIEKHGI